MTLNEARQVRDEIKSFGFSATVPLGWGPDKYFVLTQNLTPTGVIHSKEEWQLIKKGLSINPS